MPSVSRSIRVVLGVGLLALAACGDGDDGSDEAAARSGSGDERPTVVVTTNILGDVVENLVGEQADVVTIMPVGANPHDFQASAQEANAIREAEAMIVNGGGFEAGLVDVIASAERDGVPTYEAVSAVELTAAGDDGHGHGEDGHEDEHEDHAEEHAGEDPHFFTDPTRMAAAVDGITGFLVDQVDGLDTEAVEAASDAYIDELRALDAEIETTLSAIEPDRRVLITNHEVFGYFAERYDFEVIGAVIPGRSTADAASARDLAELAEVVEAEQVPAIFADTSSTDGLARALADEVAGVEVVGLYSESLGEPGSDGATYIEMMRTNAQRIADALS